MAVDLGDLIESLQREVSPPGTNLFPNAQDEEWLGHLQDAFWEARLYGMLSTFTEADGSVSPLTEGDDDLGRELQQLIVLYAGFRIILSEFRNVRASFRAKAGPVEFETSQAATVLRDVLDALKDKIGIVLTRLSDVGQGPDTVIFDAVIERSAALAYGDTWFVR